MLSLSLLHSRSSEDGLTAEAAEAAMDGSIGKGGAAKDEDREGLQRLAERL